MGISRNQELPPPKDFLAIESLLGAPAIPLKGWPPELCNNGYSLDNDRLSAHKGKAEAKHLSHQNT